MNGQLKKFSKENILLITEFYEQKWICLYCFKCMINVLSVAVTFSCTLQHPENNFIGMDNHAITNKLETEGDNKCVAYKWFTFSVHTAYKENNIEMIEKTYFYKI